jgi:hypothetical protein
VVNQVRVLTLEWWEVVALGYILEVKKAKKKNQKTQTTTKQNKNHHALLKRFWCPVERCPRSVARAGGFGEKANKQKTLNKRIMRTLKEMQ